MRPRHHPDPPAPRRLDTFFEDFIEWGRVQLDKIPETMLDGALPEQTVSVSSKTARSKAESCGPKQENSKKHTSGKVGGASGDESGGASGGGGGRTHRRRPRSTRQPPLGGKPRLKKVSSSSRGGRDGSSSSNGSSSSREKSAGRARGKGSSGVTGGGGDRGKGRGSSRGRSKHPDVTKRRTINSRVAAAERPVRGGTDVSEALEGKTGTGMADETPNSGSLESASGSNSSGSSSGAKSCPRSGSRIDFRPGSKSGSKRGFRSVTTPAHVNGSDYSEFYADCRRDGSDWPEDRPSESEEEEGGGKAYPRSRKRVKTDALNASVTVEGKENVGTGGKTMRQAAVAARNKVGDKMR